MEFDSPQAGRMRYIGAGTKEFHCGCTVTLSSAGNNEVILAALGKNVTVNANKEWTAGEILAEGQVEKKLGSAGDIHSTAIHVFITLTTNDFVELFVQNASSTADLTIKHMNMFAMEMYG